LVVVVGCRAKGVGGSGRRSLAIEIDRHRQVVVRVPLKATEREVLAFVDRYRDRVNKRLKALGPPMPEPTQAQVDQWVEKARGLLPGLVEHWAKAVGVHPQGITITGARTRFGSCSHKGRLCFSYHLMRYPRPAIDYVVLHEVCHLRHLNHSKAFNALMTRHMPDHRARRRLLNNPPQQEVDT